MRLSRFLEVSSVLRLTMVCLIGCRRKNPSIVHSICKALKVVPADGNQGRNLEFSSSPRSILSCQDSNLALTFSYFGLLKDDTESKKILFFFLNKFHFIHPIKQKILLQKNRKGNSYSISGNTRTS